MESEGERLRMKLARWGKYNHHNMFHALHPKGSDAGITLCGVPLQLARDLYQLYENVPVTCKKCIRILIGK